MLQKDSLDFVIPVYDEAECIPELLRRLLAIREKTPQIEISFIFVNDCSQDDSLSQLLRHAETHPFIRIISLSRNFGHQMAVTAGLDHADADYVCIIDADMQDPPEVVEEMYKEAKKNSLSVVYGQRRQRQGETFFKRFTAWIFYHLLRLMCQTDIPADAGDFRLIDRKVVQAMRRMGESHRFIRGMIPWVGFRSAPFFYDREPRYAGETKYPFRKMFKLALDAIFSFSTQPLRVASYLGFLLICLGFSGISYMLYLKFFTMQVVPGLMVTLAGMFILGGFQVLMLGLIGEYLGRVFEQVKGRPNYFIDLTWNIGETGCNP